MAPSHHAKPSNLAVKPGQAACQMMSQKLYTPLGGGGGGGGVGGYGLASTFYQGIPAS